MSKGKPSPYYLAFVVNKKGQKIYKHLRFIKSCVYILSLLQHVKRGNKNKYHLKGVSYRALAHCITQHGQSATGNASLYFMMWKGYVTMIPYKSFNQTINLTEIYAITPKGSKALNSIMFDIADKVPEEYNKMVEHIGKACNNWGYYFRNQIQRQATIIAMQRKSHKDL